MAGNYVPADPFAWQFAVLKHTSVPSLRLINTILKNGIIKQEEERPEIRKNANAYGITRGAAYYSKLGKDGESK